MTQAKRRSKKTATTRHRRKMHSHAQQLLDQLAAAEQAVADARAAVIDYIKHQLDARKITAYQLAEAHDIVRANLYNLIAKNRWNQNVAKQALDALGKNEH